MPTRRAARSSRSTLPAPRSVRSPLRQPRRGICVPLGGPPSTRRGSGRSRTVGQRLRCLIAGRKPSSKLVLQASALHRIAITQARIHPDAQTFIKRRIETGSTKREALRLLKRKLANVVYRTLQTDTQTTTLAQAARHTRNTYARPIRPPRVPVMSGVLGVHGV
jgi:hypothetical protein